MNQYKEILAQNLPKLLGIYNLDMFSKSYGYGDRLHWGWKVSDFANGTMQGGVHSIAVAVELGLIENTDFAMMVIDQAINAVKEIKAGNGSMVEAYPGESSFCVTALVAFDILHAIDVLGNKIPADRKSAYLDIISPLITFITKNDEEHAIISNHLATGVAAVTKWNKLSGENNQRFQSLLDIIYSHQSEEGWYKEYEGADPGYQTLCTYYLTAAYEDLQDEKLKESLIRSGQFLQHFIHPDGSIGGLYGSRNTEVYYPGGIIALAHIDNSFANMAKRLLEGYQHEAHLLPQAIDIGNYIPFLNSYSFAAYRQEKQKDVIDNSTDFVFEEKEFSETGIKLVNKEKYFAVLNYRKGGTIKVYDKVQKKLVIEDGGYFGRLKNGQLFSTQMMDENMTMSNGQFEAKYYRVNESTPSPITTIILRGLAITVFKSLFLGNMFKKMIVKMLMTGKHTLDGGVKREFKFLDTHVEVIDEITEPKNCAHIGLGGKSKAIHMASSGYYIPSVTRLSDQPLIRFICH